VRHAGATNTEHGANRSRLSARKRRFDVIAVWRFDRFARSTKHLLLALEEFRALGVQFVSYQENIDTTTPLGAAVFTIVAAVATLERDLIRERVRAGLRNARAKGKQLGRPRVILDIPRIASLRAQGRSWAEIRAELGVSKGTAQRALAGLPKNLEPAAGANG